MKYAMNSHDKTIVLLDAPSNLGLKPSAPGRQPGVYRLPEVLRDRGLQEKLGAKDGGRVLPKGYHPEIDPDSGIRNASAIAAYSLALADALAPILRRGDFPLVLGGDCSILLGSGLALKRMGRFGLCFLDGHQDLLTPSTSETGGAAGMDLALACGVGPERLIRFDGMSPLILASDVLLLGDRSGDQWYFDSRVQSIRSEMFQAGLHELRRKGIKNTISEGLKWSDPESIDGLWLHVDVLDDDIMPSVDSRQADGLSWKEFHDLIVAVLASGMTMGMQVTILDPDLDPESIYVEALASALNRAFSEARGHSI